MYTLILMLGMWIPFTSVFIVFPQTHNHISAEIQYMLHHDIVWPSFSSWASPCLLVNIQMDLTGFVLITVRQIKWPNQTHFQCFLWRIVLIKWGFQNLLVKIDLLKGYWRFCWPQELKKSLRLLCLMWYFPIMLWVLAFEMHLQPFSNSWIGLLPGCRESRFI